MRDTPAHTVAGMAVKADAVLRWLSPGGTEIPENNEDGRVAWSLARDVRRMAGGPRDDGADPDAELIAAYGRFVGHEERYEALFEGPNRIENEKERDKAVQTAPSGFSNPELPALLDVCPTTMAGVQALARLVTIEIREVQHAIDQANSAGEQIALSFLWNMTGRFDPLAALDAGEAA